MLADSLSNPEVYRERVAAILLVMFGVPALHVAFQAVSSLVAMRHTTGHVTDNELGVAPEKRPVYSRMLLELQGRTRSHDADHVCDAQRARHERGDLGCLSLLDSRRTRAIARDSGDVASHTVHIILLVTISVPALCVAFQAVSHLVATRHTMDLP